MTYIPETVIIENNIFGRSEVDCQTCCYECAV